ncbi:DUF1016 family protein [Methanofollis formosanus]|uniref:DUF1016 family protein n=2 Tax=Methanofollis formosanus TaxID=299308 RepID=A0A8G1A480_9EURY|nr:DUF1016 family protein [Methanofollis formosanus]
MCGGPGMSQNEVLPEDYPVFLAGLKVRIREAQTRAVLSANRELILLYWQIGKEIVQRQEREGWGAKVIDRLSADLKREFPDMKGFSPRNLKYMRSFARAYPDEVFVQEVLAHITWYHTVTLLDKVKDPVQREWYIRRTIANGWSRNVLVHQIERGLIEREGRAVTNFSETLPAEQSDLALQTMKDPYIFDFRCVERGAKAPVHQVSPEGDAQGGNDHDCREDKGCKVGAHLHLSR